MLGPPSQKFSAQECSFQTPEEVSTWELVTSQLNIHTQAAHSTASVASSKGKTAKTTRPSVKSSMSEESWRFYLDEWERYKQQTL